MKNLLARLIQILLWGMLGLVFFAHALFALYIWMPIPGTPLMAIRSYEALKQWKSPIYSYDWVPLEEMSKRLPEVSVAAEDSKFYSHHGFDFEAIEKAAKNNRKGKRIKGGSTISQQVAKKLFLWPKRSGLRKGLEVYWTVLIEGLWSKDRIMEVYLNIVELGNGVYGVEAASQKFFKKPANKLSRSEASLLAAVLPNPRQMRVDAPSSYVRMRQTLILRRSYQVDLGAPAIIPTKSRRILNKNKTRVIPDSSH
ncbi:MAG: monofunctional biosynthetic peptidoglycan transglycosylase [Pseudobdellovibrionaceae bacterium]